MVLEHLCACSSNVHQQEGGTATATVSTSAVQRSSMVSLDDEDEAAAGVVVVTTNHNNQVMMVDRLDEAYRIDINDPNYFDNVILAARKAPSNTPSSFSKSHSRHKVPRPSTKKKRQHRKTKSLTRWDKLRAVVASHEESSVSSSGYGYFEDLSAASFDEADPRYPSKMQRLTSNYRQSSMVLDTEDEEVDEMNEDDYEDDILLNPIVMMTEHTTPTSPAREDERRMAPPRSPSTSRDDHEEATYHDYLLATQQQQGRQHDYQEYMELVACSSFDPDLDTSKYVEIEPSSSSSRAAGGAAEDEEEVTAARSTPPTSSRRQLATPPARPIRSRPPALSLSTPRTTAEHEDGVQLDAESLDEAAESLEEAADNDQITPLPHRAVVVDSPVRVPRIRTPPSPSYYSTAGDTCTTISLSQSYVNSFDREEHEDINDETDQMFLDRLASEHLLTGIPSPPRPVVTDLLLDEEEQEETASVSSSAFFFEESSSTHPHSSSLMTNKSKSNIKKTLIQKIGGGNPFRNLKPGSSSSNKNKKIPNKTKFVPASYSAETKDEAEEEEEEGIEHTLGEANDENLYPTKPNTTQRASSYAGRLPSSSKLSRDDADDDDDECATHSTSSIAATTHLAYRYLIRMNPQHYKHRNGSQCSLTKGTDDDKEAAAAAPEALLLPLHPHQRIMAPLPHHDSPFDEDHSGYTYFPETVRRHQGMEDLHHHPNHNHRQPAEPQPLFPLLD